MLLQIQAEWANSQLPPLAAARQQPDGSSANDTVSSSSNGNSDVASGSGIQATSAQSSGSLQVGFSAGSGSAGRAAQPQGSHGTDPATAAAGGVKAAEKENKQRRADGEHSWSRLWCRRGGSGRRREADHVELKGLASSIDVQAVIDVTGQPCMHCWLAGRRAAWAQPSVNIEGAIQQLSSWRALVRHVYSLLSA